VLLAYSVTKTAFQNHRLRDSRNMGHYEYFMGKMIRLRMAF